MNNLLEINIVPSSGIPLYAQIVEQVKLFIAAGKLLPGEKLPTVRELANDFQFNPGTVARAYVELEREGVVHTRRGAGSFVSNKLRDKSGDLFREGRLSALFNQCTMEGLSLGYTPEELETNFILHLARWREERNSRKTVPQTTLAGGDAIVFMGSHDLAVELLASQMRQHYPELPFQVSYPGSLEGLIALGHQQAHLSGIHLRDEETGEYNIPYVRRVMPGQRIILVNLAYRVQGIMIPPGNPRGIHGLEDLRRSDITFVNRQRGSGTRVFLDQKLRDIGISPGEIRGYGQEVTSHLAIATAVASGTADFGLGIMASARAMGLDFLPLTEEPYDLVIPQQYYEGDILLPLLQLVTSSEFKKSVATLSGYRTHRTGEVTRLY